MDEPISERIRSNVISLKDRKDLSVTGVSEIISFDDSMISLDISDSQLNIEGQALKIELFSKENGEVRVTGHIEAMIYVGKTEASYRKGILKRIFSYDE